MKVAGWLGGLVVFVLFIPMLAIATISASAAVPPPCVPASPATPTASSDPPPPPDTESATDPCPPDVAGGGSGESLIWSDGADCGFKGVENPRSCNEALSEAAHIATEEACKNAVRGGTWFHRCLEFVGRVYGYAAAGTPTALQHYSLLKSRGLIDTNSTDIPAGALVFFTSGQPEGHVAIYAGDGKAFSNDYLRRGCIDLTPMSTLASGGRFLGWAPPVFPNGDPV